LPEAYNIFSEYVWWRDASMAREAKLPRREYDVELNSQLCFGVP